MEYGRYELAGKSRSRHSAGIRQIVLPLTYRFLGGNGRTNFQLRQAAELHAGAGLNQPSASSGSSSECCGWSVPLRPDIVGRFIGLQGRNIQELQRSLNVKKLSVEEHDGAQCVYIVAASQASVEEAQRAVENKVRELLR